MKRKHIKHLYWRVGFGILPSELEKLSKKSKKEVVNALFDNSTSPTPLYVDISELEKVINASNGNKLGPEARMKIQKISRKKQMELNVAWIERLATSKQILREKLTLFWANHFVCEDNFVNYIQQFNNTLRQHALGNFKDFVNAISKEAAMSKYLNTKQNKKQKPNENFARELMELFTLGEGQYTEVDIKESARAFTGYSHNLNGAYVFKDAIHDYGEKTFFGKTGNFKGEDIVDIILEHKQCAKYICQKLYRYYVNDTINDIHVGAMTEVFYKDYNIEHVMRYMLMSDWFYDEEHIGNKIKSPIEFLVGLKRMVPITFSKPQQLIYIQKLLGQTLLDPPNVAGWKGGRSWIDSNTIVLRLKLPSLLVNSGFISNNKLGDTSSDKAELRKATFKQNFGKRFKTTANWDSFYAAFKQVGLNDLDTYILACSPSPNAQVYLNHLEKTSKQEYCVQLMSLPEYQIC